MPEDIIPVTPGEGEVKLCRNCGGPKEKWFSDPRKKLGGYFGCHPCRLKGYSRFHEKQRGGPPTKQKPIPCNKCGADKTFCPCKGKQKHRKKGFWVCLPCRKTYLNNYYQDNAEEARRVAKENHNKNRDRNNAASRIYHRINKVEQGRKKRIFYLNNKIKVDTTNRKWRERNKAKLVESARNHYLNNKVKYLEWNRARRRTEEGRHTLSCYSHAYRARKKSNGCSATPKMMREAAQGITACQYCGEEGIKLTWDHIVPISKGGHHSIPNLARCCKPCNSSKQNKDPREWYASRGIDPSRFLPKD